MGYWRDAQQTAKERPGDAALLLQLAGGRIEAISARTVAEASQTGDPLALKLMDNLEKALIAGSISIVDAFAPERFILGGGLIEGSPDLIKAIGKGIKKNALPAAVKSLQVQEARLGQDSGVVGAAALAMGRFANPRN